MKQWEDTSSYSRGEERIPHAFAIELGRFSLRIHRYHGLQGWFTSCNGLFDCKTLSSVETEAAKAEAVSFFRTYLVAALNEANDISAFRVAVV